MDDTQARKQRRFKPIPRINPNNVVISEENVNFILNSVFRTMNKKSWRTREIEPVLIRNITHYINACTHCSYRSEAIELHKMYPEMPIFIPETDYEILEFLGDAMLTAIVVNILVSMFPDESEHFLTTMKIRLIKDTMYASWSRWLGLQEFILLSSHEEKGRNNTAILEDVFEAFIGAIISDFGFEKGIEIANKFVTGIIEECINWPELIMTPTNVKDSAIQYYRNVGWSKELPPFEILYQHGRPNERVFGVVLKLQKSIVDTLPRRNVIYEYTLGIMNVIPEEHHSDEIRQRLYEIQRENNYIVGFGIGKKRRKAEEEASREAFKVLDVDPNFTILRQ